MIKLENIRNIWGLHKIDKPIFRDCFICGKTRTMKYAVNLIDNKYQYYARICEECAVVLSI